MSWKMSCLGLHASPDVSPTLQGYWWSGHDGVQGRAGVWKILLPWMLSILPWQSTHVFKCRDRPGLWLMPANWAEIWFSSMDQMFVPSLPKVAYGDPGLRVIVLRREATRRWWQRTHKDTNSTNKSSLTLLPCEVALGGQLSVQQEAGRHQLLNLSVLWSWPA